jgi:hypothetical protein
MVLLIISAFFYALPFFFPQYLWWLIFVFPVPLLYVTCTQTISFLQGYMWGVIVFILHLHAGIFIVADLARDMRWVGYLMGFAMIAYQALVPAFLFWLVTKITHIFLIKRSFVRLALYTLALALFIWWTDQYCLWIFGIKEGYPFMHPLLPLAQQPKMLLLLPILGKQLLILLFLLVPASFVILLWYKNSRALLFFVCAVMPWIMCFVYKGRHTKLPGWHHSIKSLPCMIHATGNNPEIIMKIVARHLKTIIEQYPEVTTIIMPESALNITDCVDKPKLLHLCSKEYVGKPLHFIFGACRKQDDCYYNALHWVYNGQLRACFDKKHAMLMTERLSDWMNGDLMRGIYFKEEPCITRSCNNRTLLQLTDGVAFVPYICSELFFNEYPDDCYSAMPIIAIINDILLVNSFMQKLLLLLARFKAMQWQRDIVYVAYGDCVFIDKQGEMRTMNE